MTDSDPIRSLVRRAVNEAMDEPESNPDHQHEVAATPARSRRGNGLRVVAFVPLAVLVGGGFFVLQQRQTSTVAATQKSRPKIMFPVDAPYHFVDTFGAPRMMGTKYAHKHQGVEVFASEGAPIRALADGAVFGVGVSKLGGNKLWLSSGGTCFYYALIGKLSPAMEHLMVRSSTTEVRTSKQDDWSSSSEFRFSQVRAGTVLGWVGSLAQQDPSAPAGVHLEVHPKCGDRVNPMPVLNALKSNDVKTFEKLTKTTSGDVVAIDLGMVERTM
jgi:hypothetical protein